ncbi:MAG TPA: two-component sensor histidine kinase, partial [Lachnospiraceae bacterium]|nr:two-component sensor histidine kinase [Lachnospiraceae bacterium]
IETALNMTGQDVLQEIGAFAEPNRLTLIAKDGTVLFDSEGDVSNWQNHASRQEVIQAEQNGEGEALRRSDTLDRQTYYYARRLKDGSILRISQTTDTVLSTVVNLLPMVGLIAVIMLTFAWLLGRWQTRKLIQPINELDLEHPMEKVVYDELRPLLKSIENQNQEKEKNERMRKEFSANVSHELK